MNAILQKKKKNFFFLAAHRGRKLGHSNPRVKPEGSTQTLIMNILIVTLLASMLKTSCAEDRSYSSMFCCSTVKILN